MTTELKKPKRIRNHINPLSILKINQIQPFPDKKQVIFDIGSYRGEFVEELNQKIDRNFVIFEIRKPFYQYLKEKFKNYPNIQVFDGDAAKSLPGMIKDLKEWGYSVDKIFINFPDPWFKKKHHKRRFLQKELLDQLFPYLEPQNEIIFQTDQRRLFWDTRKIVDFHQNFSQKRFFKPLWGVQSYWEKMKISEGSPIFRFKIWKKTSNPIKNFFLWLKK